MSEHKDEVEVFEDEKGLLLDHNYDGIKELNHPLPSWWLTIFYLTIIFSVGYYSYYTFMSGPTLQDEYVAEITKVEEAKAAFKKEQGGFDLDAYNAYIAGPKAAKVAKKTYKRKCKACHGPDGGGGVGPNLADKYWLHGNGSLETVYNTIYHGVPDKGMQAWGDALGEEKMFAVLKYVMDFQGTTPTNPKEPQGALIE